MAFRTSEKLFMDLRIVLRMRQSVIVEMMCASHNISMGYVK